MIETVVEALFRSLAKGFWKELERRVIVGVTVGILRRLNLVASRK